MHPLVGASTYDATDQFTGEWRGGANAYDTTYTYDGMGNRLVQNSSGQRTSYTYDLFNRLLNQINPDGTRTTYSYDGAGNRTLEQTGSAVTTYTWDYENRMSGVVNPDGSSESYLYLLDGPRDIASGMNLLQEKDGSGVTQAHYTGRPDTMQSLLTIRRGSDSRIVGPDVQDSVRILVDLGENITDTYLYTGYGVQLANSGTFANNFRYVGGWGYYFDAAGRIYVRARVYDPVTGRWYSVDPTGLRSGKQFAYISLAEEENNLYQYCLNSPTKYLDPTGLIILADPIPPNHTLYCGFTFRGPGTPVDCIDNACSTHDNCVGASILLGYCKSLSSRMSVAEGRVC